MSVRVPKYRHHKASGQALVQIHGERIYLGAYNSAKSRERYRQLITEYLAQPTGPRVASSDTKQLTVNRLMLAYYRYAQTYYLKNGEPTDELAGIRSALRRLRKTYGSTLAVEFGPKAFKLVRESMIQEELSRKYINDSMSRIRRMFRWAVSEELLPASVFQALAAVPGLKRGRSKAKETRPVQSVPDETVEATLVCLPPVVADMVRLQRLTGCRPHEICLLRPADVCRDGDVWEYRPQTHKNEHRGQVRVILIGPQAQKILAPYLLRAAEAYCFSPAESERARRLALRRNGSKPTTSERKPTKPASKSRFRDHYTRQTYRRAVDRACEKAEVEKWSPNQLRHAAATSVRKQFGLDAAQTVLGHARADTTEIYAELDLEKARRIMREVG